MKITFVYKNKTYFQKFGTMTLNEIDRIKYNLAANIPCCLDDTEVLHDTKKRIFSTIDIDSVGMFDYRDSNLAVISGVALSCELGCDEHLDAINSGNEHDLLIFI